VHILAAIIAVLVLADAAVGLVRLVRALRRQRIPDKSGALVLEGPGAYLHRLFRTVLPTLVILLILAVVLMTIVYFGPIKPIHEW
jgi:hypothetical protein